MQDKKVTLKSLMLFLGQLEYNIEVSRKSLESMEKEKMNTLHEIHFLMTQIENSTQEDEPQSDV